MILRLGFVCLSLLSFVFSGCSKSEQASKEELRFSIPFDPSSLDPRQARDLVTMDIERFLFRGLTRINRLGFAEEDLAESITPSDDGLSYEIRLKPAVWSDGLPITSEDFVHSWKSMLDRERAFPNAFQLFWLKGAKEAYEGKAPLDSLSVKAVDERTIHVELARPCPFFKELLATTSWYAVQKAFDLSHKEFGRLSSFPVDGPYEISSWAFQNALILKRNEHYEYKDKYPYQKVSFSVIDNQTAMIMFENGALDWVGSPLGCLPIESLPSLRRANKVSFQDAAGTYFLRFNTTSLSDQRLRKAVSVVINRKELVDHVLQGGQKVAFSFIPPCMRKKDSSPSPEANGEELFSAYCQEKGLKPQDICLRFLFMSDARAQKIAESIQQDIQKKLHCRVLLQPAEGKFLFSRISALDYDIALSSWILDFLDPYSLYAVFESAKNGTNNTGWESPRYKDELQRSLSMGEREKAFQELDGILQEECPIAPLFYASFAWQKKEGLQDVTLSPLGSIDVRKE